jgi:hypothetical protein
MGVRDLDHSTWLALYKKVLRHALTRTRRDEAEDLTQRAFWALMTTRPWNEESGTPLLNHMIGIFNSLLSHERTSKRPENERTAEVEWASAVGDVAVSTEEAHLLRAIGAEREHDAAAAIGELAKRASGSPVEMSVLSAMLDGVTAPAEQAEYTKHPIEEVYLARQRLRRLAQSIQKGARSNEEPS